MFKNFIKIVFFQNIFKNKFKFLAIFLIFLSIISCGKKSPIEKPDNYSRPDFSRISDENK